MERLGKKVIGVIIGVLLFILIQTVRSHLGIRGEDTREKVTQADADLYLQVMRATAARVKNPTAEDQATMDAFTRIKNVRTASASDLSADEKNTIQEAIMLTSRLDEIVAKDMKVDQARYEHAKEVVEAFLPPPEEDHPSVSTDLTEAEKKGLESKGKVLAPYALEIKDLYTTIANNPYKQTAKGS